jgi:uncharacterized protein HemX
MMSQEYPANPQPEYADPTPYGVSEQPVKPGLTKRGKAGIAIVTAVIAGGGLLGWQHYAAQQADANQKAQEIALKQQELRLEELKEKNKAQAVNAKTQSTQNAALQKQIDACVNDNKGLVGKQLGATYRSVIEDCQAQYGSTSTSSGNMQNAASATSTNPSGGGVNTGLLVGGAVLAGGIVLVARKSTRSNQT